MIDDDLPKEQDVSGKDDHSASAEPLVTCDDAVMGGEPVFTGTRIPIASIAAMLGDTSDDEILQGYPALTPLHLAAARRWPPREALAGRSPSLAESGFRLVSRTSVALGSRAQASRR